MEQTSLCTESGVPLIPSQSEQVKQFTEEGYDIKLPEKPTPLSKAEVTFLIRMRASENMELLQSLCDSPLEIFYMMLDSMRTKIDWNYRGADQDLSEDKKRVIRERKRVMSDCNSCVVKDGMPFLPCPSHQAIESILKTSGIHFYTDPMPLTKKEAARFLSKEMEANIRLAQTVCKNTWDALCLVKDSFGVDFKVDYKRPVDEIEVMAEQADAVVDGWYYTLNVFAKKGINLSRVFDHVHRANLNKRWADGKYHRRESDNKIIKPDGFVDPDIHAEIQHQIQHGGFKRIKLDDSRELKELQSVAEQAAKRIVELEAELSRVSARLDHVTAHVDSLKK